MCKLYKHRVNLLNQLNHSICWHTHSESVTRKHATSVVWSQKKRKTAEREKGSFLILSVYAETKTSSVAQSWFRGFSLISLPPSPLFIFSSVKELRKVKHDMDFSLQKFLRHWLYISTDVRCFHMEITVSDIIFSEKVLSSFDQKRFSSVSHKSGQAISGWPSGNSIWM